MSHGERRIQRVAIGCAVAAVVVALVAVVVVVRRDRDASGAATVTRRVRAGDLAKLAPAVVRSSPGGGGGGGGGVIVDAPVGDALGLAPGDILLAISGREIDTAPELAAVLRALVALHPRRWFVELARGDARIVERWDIDGDLTAAFAAVPDRAPWADPLSATVRQTGATVYEVPRTSFEAWTMDPSRITRGVVAVPRAAGDGFELRTVRPGSAIAALGLQDGDVVRAIDGQELAAADLILPLVVRSGPTLSLDLRRGGRTVILNYLIR